MSSLSIHKCLGVIAIVFCAALAGCQSEPPDELPPQPQRSETQKPQQLKILSIDDPQQLAARIAQVWRAQTTGEIEIIYANSEELFATPNSTIPECDIVIYPSVLIGELLTRDSIQPLDAMALAEKAAVRRGLLRHDRTTLVQIGKTTFGTSLGSPMLMLLYRRDVLEQLKLEVPQSWLQYQVVLAALKASPELKDDAGRALPTQVLEPTANSWLAEYFLARAAASFVRQGRLSSYFDVESMKSLVNTPPFVETLEQMADDLTLQARTAATPADCYAAIVKGDAAMAIAWVSSQPTIESAAEILPVAVAPLPGSSRVYDYREKRWIVLGKDEVLSAPTVPIAGRIASVTATTRRLRTATRFATWLMTAEANREFSTQFADTLFTQSAQLAKPFDWVNEQLPREAAQQMAETLGAYHDQSLVLYSMRIPGRATYLRILADAVRTSLDGKAAPQAALDSAAGQWDALTEQLGRDRQRKFFQDSVRMEF